MSGEVKAKVGTKLTEEEQKKLDKSKVGKLQAKHPKGAVQAQYTAIQVCPYCGCIGYGEEDPNVYMYFTCHCCGLTFKA